MAGPQRPQIGQIPQQATTPVPMSPPPPPGQPKMDATRQAAIAAYNQRMKNCTPMFSPPPY